jgi:Uma2 family endonuclease
VRLDRSADYRYLDLMALTEQLMDADAFLARPPTRWREELIDGRIVVNEPVMRHQLAAAEILFALDRWIREGSGSGRASLPVNLRVSDHNVFSPDVLWYADAGRTDVDASAQLHPPDLVIEVRSPSTWKYDVGVKSERYAGWGVGELWLVDLVSRIVIVRRRTGTDSSGFDVVEEVSEEEALTSPRLPGFALRVQEIFAIPGEHQK